MLDRTSRHQNDVHFIKEVGRKNKTFLSLLVILLQRTTKPEWESIPSGSGSWLRKIGENLLVLSNSESIEKRCIDRREKNLLAQSSRVVCKWAEFSGASDTQAP
jgi:hypothetical protein